MSTEANWVLERLDKLISRYEVEPATLDKFFSDLRKQMTDILTELRIRTDRVEGIVTNQEDDFDKLRQLGINEMLALKFIENNGLLEEFERFSTRKLHELSALQRVN